MSEKVDLAKLEEYNREPVYFCKHCLSLSIMALNASIDFCDKCGHTDIGVCDIDEWKKLYHRRYGKHFIKEQNFSI